MYAMTITFTDFDGEESTEKFYFNMSAREITKMGLRGKAMRNVLMQLIESDDIGGMVDIIEGIILDAYGVKSADGKSFVKNAENRELFENSAAYSAIFTKLVSNNDELLAFIQAIMPKEVSDQMTEMDLAKSREELLENL